MDRAFECGDYTGTTVAVMRQMDQFGGCPDAFIDAYADYLQRVGERGLQLDEADAAASEVAQDSAPSLLAAQSSIFRNSRSASRNYG